MKAIILAAGFGKRLQAVSGGKPKSMIEVGDTSIIHRQILTCKSWGIHDFVIVVGYRSEEVIDHVLQCITPDDVTFITNPDWATTNTLHSLWLTRDQFTDSFLYFNGDVVLSPALLEPLAESGDESLLLIEEKACGEEEVKVIVDERDRILQIGKKLAPSQCAGEFIGVARFGHDCLERFSALLDEGVRTGHGNDYFEYAVDLLTREIPCIAVSTGGLPCIEIDFPEDLQRAVEEILPQLDAE